MSATTTLTPNKEYPLQPVGANVGRWGTVLNGDFISVLDKNLGATLEIVLSGNADRIVSDSEAENIRHNLTGALTGNIDYILPARGSFYIISNNTTGGFEVTVKPSGGTGGVLSAAPTFVFINTDTNAAETIVGGAPSYPVSVSNGGSGSSTAEGARNAFGVAYSDQIVGNVDGQLVIQPETVTAALLPFVGDEGAGGAQGVVPAPAAGDAAAGKYLKADGTWEAVPGLTIPPPSPTDLGGVFSDAGTTHEFMYGIDTDGSALKAQPAFSDLSGFATVLQGGTSLTAITAHSLIIGNGTGTPNLLAPSATSGVPVVSAGASADPVYGTVALAGLAAGNPTYSVKNYIARGSTFAQCDTDASAAGQPLIMDYTTADIAISTNTAVASSIITMGGKFSVATGVTLTCNGAIFGFLGLFKWTGTGAIVLNGDCVTETSWFSTVQDGKVYCGAASATATATSVTITGATYSSADIGHSLVLAGAGTAGVPHKTTITGGSGTTFNVADAIVTTVSSVNCGYGTDNLAAFTMAMTSRVNQVGVVFHSSPCSSATGTTFWTGIYHMSDKLTAMGYTNQTWHANGAILDNCVYFIYANCTVNGLMVFGSPQNGFEWNRTGSEATYRDMIALCSNWHGFAPGMNGLTARTNAQMGSGTFIRCISDASVKDGWHIDASGASSFYNNHRHFGCSGRGAGAYGLYGNFSYGFFYGWYSESCGGVTSTNYAVKFVNGAYIELTGFIQDQNMTSGAIDVSGVAVANLGGSNIIGAINIGSCLLNFSGRNAVGATPPTGMYSSLPDTSKWTPTGLSLFSQGGAIKATGFAGAANPLIAANGTSSIPCYGTYQNSTASRTHVTFENTNGTVGSITTSGSATAYVTSSDYRRKENETPLDGKTAIMGLKPYEFTWKVDGQRDSGMFAHELQQYIPNAVVGQKDAIEDIGVLKNADGLVIHDSISEPLPEEMLEGQTWEKTGSRPVYQQVDYSKIVPYLVAHCQDLERRLAAFEGKSA